MKRRVFLTSAAVLVTGCAGRTRSDQSSTPTKTSTPTPAPTPTVTTTRAPETTDTTTHTRTRTETATPTPTSAERDIQTALQSLKRAQKAYIRQVETAATILDVTAASTSFTATEVHTHVDDARITLSGVDTSNVPDDVRRRVNRLSDAATILRRIVNTQDAVTTAFGVHLRLRRAFYAGGEFKLHHNRDSLRSKTETINSSLGKLSNENLSALDELSFWPPKGLRDKISQLKSERDAFEFFIGWYKTAADGFDALNDAVQAFKGESFKDVHRGCYNAESAFEDADTSLQDYSFPTGIDDTTDEMECVLGAILEAIPELDEAGQAAANGNDALAETAARRARDAFASCSKVEQHYAPL